MRDKTAPCKKQYIWEKNQQHWIIFKLHEFKNMTDRWKGLLWYQEKEALDPLGVSLTKVSMSIWFSYQGEYEAEATEPCRIAVLVQVFALEYW